MSTSAAGRLVDENGAPWPGFTVAARDTDPIFVDEDLGSALSGANGRFTLAYEADQFAPTHGPRNLEFDVLDRVHRRLTRLEREDVSGASLDLGDVVIRRKDATGYLVTLGTGTAERVTKGNAVELLVDNERAWRRLNELLKTHPLRTINLMQLGFDVPSEFESDPREEEPVMVLEFDRDSPIPDKDNVQEGRPEFRLLSAAGAGPDVRILLNRFELEGHAFGASLIVPGLGLVAWVLGWLITEQGGFTSVDEVQRYFGAADKPAEGDGHRFPKLRVLEARAPFFGPTHAKLAIVERQDIAKNEALVLGSPFAQAYFGDHPHAIDDPRRGDGTKHPIHDVSLSVRGPAVADLLHAFALHWNTATSPDPQRPPPPIEEITRPPEIELGAPIAALQIVRTLDSGRFPDPEDGEQGILEAYLRAIGLAQRLLYLENQFFTNETIAAALVRALKDPSRPDLQVIMLLNILPDSVLYARWQRKLIARMRDGLTDAERARFGVFTRWSHEGPRPPARTRPNIAPTYVHSKVGIADDTWATVGSANLDGTSLDVTHYFHGLTFGDVRASEINCLILNGVEDQPETFVVDLLRRELWAEHLGFVVEGRPEPNVEELATPPPVGGWLALWDRQANLKRDQLRTNPTAESPIAVLPWPHVDRTLKHPREHLEAALGRELTNLEPIAATRAYSFEQGKFTDERLEVDD